VETSISSNVRVPPAAVTAWRALGRAVPAHARPGHVIGVLVLLLVAVQFATGLLLMVYYRPSAHAAHHSIGILTDEVRLGWLFRSLHAWGAHLVILLSLVHLIRVYFARAYVAPRGPSWATGIVLFVVVLAFAFTGTLLPWDQYAYWSIDAARTTIAGIPLVGSALLSLFWGGWEIGEEVLLRFYAFHVGILPLAVIACLAVHLGTVWNAGLQVNASAAAGPVATRPLAELLLDLLVLVLLACGVWLTCAVVAPPLLLGPADPLTPLAEPPPHWYLLPARQMLRNLPPAGAALAVIALFLLFLSIPLLDRGAQPPRWRLVLQRAVGVLAIAAWLALAARQYAG
jgi:quinol-cytochrome oxidoreductase complex cytochrome b subunit